MASPEGLFSEPASPNPDQVKPLGVMYYTSVIRNASAAPPERSSRTRRSHHSETCLYAWLIATMTPRIRRTVHYNYRIGFGVPTVTMIVCRGPLIFYTIAKYPKEVEIVVVLRPYVLNLESSARRPVYSQVTMSAIPKTSSKPGLERDKDL